jgi:hypothetical protein
MITVKKWSKSAVFVRTTAAVGYERDVMVDLRTECDGETESDNGIGESGGERAVRGGDVVVFGDLWLLTVKFYSDFTRNRSAR